MEDYPAAWSALGVGLFGTSVYLSVLAWQADAMPAFVLFVVCIALSMYLCVAPLIHTWPFRKEPEQEAEKPKPGTLDRDKLRAQEAERKRRESRPSHTMDTFHAVREQTRPAPLPPPAAGTEARRRLDTEKANLGEVLRKELDKGIDIMRSLPKNDPDGLARAEAVARKRRPPANASDISEWERGVKAFLSVPNYEAFLAHFTKANPPLEAKIGYMAKQLQSPDKSAELRDYMSAKIAALTRIVEELTK